MPHARRARPPFVEAARLLRGAFGRSGWWPVAERPGAFPRYRPERTAPPTDREAFEIACGAVLTQNTAWTGAARAVAALRAEGLLASPRALSAAPPRTIERLVRPAGYFRMKTRRLCALAAFFAREGVARLRRVPTETLRARLLSVPGVGRETADSILAYGFHRPVFVVDAYTRRIFARHGWIAPAADYDAIRSAVEAAFAGRPAGARGAIFRDFHAHLVEVGKRFCRPREARCEECPLAPLL